jgi:hypothetical protein
MRRFDYVPWTALGPRLSERFVHLAAPASRAQFYLRKPVGTVDPDSLAEIGAFLSRKLPKQLYFNASYREHSYSYLS